MNVLSAFFATLVTCLMSCSALAFTIGAYNIRNFDYDTRYRIHTNKPALANILKEIDADLLSVEEINNTQEFEKFIERELPGYGVVLSSCGGAHGQRLGFIYKKSTIEFLDFHEDLSVTNPGSHESCDSGSRPLGIGLFQITSTKQRFYALSAHLKSGSAAGSMRKRAKQYEAIKEVVQELKSKSGVKDFMLAGDLNTTDFITRGPDAKAFTKTVQAMGMQILTQNISCSSYWWGGTNDGIESPSVLDHVVVTPGLIKTRRPKVAVAGHCQEVNCREVPIKELGQSYESVSDHCPITATIQ